MKLDDIEIGRRYAYGHRREPSYGEAVDIDTPPRGGIRMVAFNEARYDGALMRRWIPAQCVIGLESDVKDHRTRKEIDESRLNYTQERKKEEEQIARVTLKSQLQGNPAVDVRFNKAEIHVEVFSRLLEHHPEIADTLASVHESFRKECAERKEQWEARARLLFPLPEEESEVLFSRKMIYKEGR